MLLSAQGEKRVRGQDGGQSGKGREMTVEGKVSETDAVNAISSHRRRKGVAKREKERKKFLAYRRTG